MWKLLQCIKFCGKIYGEINFRQGEARYCLFGLVALFDYLAIKCCQGTEINKALWKLKKNKFSFSKA